MDVEKLSGLSDDQVIKHRDAFGANKVDISEKNNFLLSIKGVVFEPLFIILLSIAIIYFILQKNSEGLVMILALCFVSGISLYQEHKSRNAVDSLKKLADPVAKVRRNGIDCIIPVESLVVDDIFYNEDGNVIPADGIVIRVNDFSVDESVLTGESLPVFKYTGVGTNVIFKGTVVVSGSCMAKVSAVGLQTELGKIGVSLKNVIESDTPLQIQIRRFTKTMVIFGAIAFLIVWLMNYLISKDVLQSLLKGLTLAMSVLPEEIPVAFSTFMALGAYHLFKKNVIAKSPYTVETLGAATVICTDKTGTLTQNKMGLAGIFDIKSKSEIDYTTGIPFGPSKVLEYAMWASETEPYDAMEKTIHEIYAKTSDIDQRSFYHMIKEYPLSGQPPIMTHIHKHNDGSHIIAVKGGVEGLINLSVLSASEKQYILDVASEMAKKGFRVLGVGSSASGLNDLPEIQHEFIFDFIGLIAFYDPPKVDIEHTIQQFYKAGIDIKMITGDHAHTASAIARQIGMGKGIQVLSGLQVMESDLKNLKELVKTTNIFARMFPEAKLKVIEALKSNGEVVAMTGDGVNDGPALKSAHIGIAMGKSGSEVAKSAAALILMDDNLAWMVDAIAYGRKIYENLKKAIRYIISIHIPIILIVAIPLLLYWKYTNIFSPVHVIFLELIMGPTCSIVFENEPIEENSMRKRPRKLMEDFFSFNELFLSIIQGIIITIGCLGFGYYLMVNGNEEPLVRTVIYTTLIFSNVFLTLVNRSFYFSVFKTIKYKNDLIPIMVFISILILFLSIFIAPVQHVFSFTSLNPLQMIQCIVIAFVCVFWVEIYKYWLRSESL
ncbi:MAG: cation-translocating P-type ATPase [Saprospiraceae bacterium]|nr:cation-translocating P-type ATPase [Saprospiraceae bacterium]